MPDHGRMDASHPSRSRAGTVAAMVRRFVRFLLPSGLLLVVALLVRRSVHLRSEVFRVVPSRDAWPPITEVERPPPPVTAQTEAAETEAAQTEAAETEAAPTEAAETEAAPTETVQASAARLAPADGECPPTHVIKAKEASGIYHLPGMANYNRTKPDRCYAEESAAEADGFTKAKR
ncbi:MAG: hypothetical protein QOE57_828 [Acidimicrobiaceae bacterium]|nr:hypothetical protein [Acidimicrobiaceae bacterium]